jgi:hypothetical protein
MTFNPMPGLQFFDEFKSGSQDFGMDNINPELRLLSQGLSLSWHVQHQFQQQSQLEQPIQRFIHEPERNFFSATHLLNQLQGFSGLNRPGAPISSPSPYGAPTSSCSSALSPPTENDWSQDSLFPHQIRDNHSFPQTMSQFGHGHPDLWFAQFKPHSAHSIDPCIQLSQIQAYSNMPPGEVTYGGDEGYDEMAMKTEYDMEMDNRMLKTESGHSSYRYPSDEGLGASIKDEGSPQHSTIYMEHDAVSDADGDAEGDNDQDVLVAREVSDTEYTPKSTRTRKRTASKAISPPASKHPRNAKSISKTKGQFACKSYDHAPYKDATALHRHTASSHTRAFICVFAFAGCTSTFGSKNEWKRHTLSQHLNLSAWVCELQACGKVQNQSKNGNTTVKSSEFKRKDLFTQHLRRMHAPFSVKRMQKKDSEWEEYLKKLQVSCLRVKRQAPSKLSCPLASCKAVFEGSRCWDDRMEHVGKHLEKAAASIGANKFEVRQENDEFLVAWALREVIIKVRPGTNMYRLCVEGSQSRVDEDAEGEEE